MPFVIRSLDDGQKVLRQAGQGHDMLAAGGVVLVGGAGAVALIKPQIDLDLINIAGMLTRAERLDHSVLRVDLEVVQ